MGLGAKQMVDLAVEKGRKVMGDAFSRWEPMIVRAASLLESVFTNGLDKTLENLGSAASDKLAELKTAMRSTWHEMSSDFKGFLLDQLSSVVPGLLKSELTSLTPLKFINLLDVLVKLCETAGDFLDRVTGSIKEARECGPRAIGKIAGHTKAFVGEAAPKALGAILNVLVGNLPRQMVARKTQMFTMKVAADTSTGHGSIGTLPSLEQKQESRRNTGWLRKVDRTGLHFLAEQNPFPGLSVGGRRGESGNRLPPLLHKLIDRGR